MKSIKARSVQALGFGWATAWLLALLWMPTVSGQEESGTQAEPAAEVAQEAGEGTAAEVEEDYDWVMDEKRGRRYRIERIPKVEKTYRWISETEVRFPGGARFEVVDEEESWFQVKVYERLPNREALNKRPTGPSAEETARVEASYSTSFETVDSMTFQKFDEGLPRSGQWRNGFDVADMNGDGHKDIVFGPARKGRSHPNIFLGDGAGKWQRWSDVKYARAPYDYGDVAVGDLDGDGHPDMVFGIHLRGIFITRSNGAGGFEPWSEGVEVDTPGKGGDATSFSSRAVKLVDWDGDDRLDIVAFGEGPKGLQTQKDKRGANQLINTSRGFLVYLNGGDGQWKIHTQERGDNRRANFGDDFAIDDLDGDGNWDLVSSTRQLGSLAILAETDGTSITYREIEAVRPKGFVDAVEIVDVNADGRKDIVMSYRNRELEVWRAGVDILYTEKDGTFRREALYSTEGKNTIGSLGLGDLNQDGHQDIVFGTSEGTMMVFVGDAEKGFVLEESTELDQKRQGCHAFDITLVDLDGDSKVEVLAGFAGEPTGYPGFPNLSKPGCVREGSIRVWKVAAKE